MNESARAKSSRLKLSIVLWLRALAEALSEFQAHPSQNQSPGICPQLVSRRVETLPLERCGAESFELNKIDPLLSAMLSLYQHVVEFVYSLDECFPRKTWRINFGVGPVFQGISMSAIEGLIASHHHARVADLGRAHETVVTWRLNVAERPVFQHKGRVLIHK